MVEAESIATSCRSVTGVLRMEELSALYSAHRDSIFRYLRRRLGDPGRAEELTQDVFIRMAGLIERTVVNNPKAVLFTIASNLLIDTIRRDRLRRGSGYQVLDNPDSTLCTQPPVETALDDERRLQWLIEAMAALPPRCREAFILRKIEGLSYDEIAASMQVSVKTVEKHLVRALLECRAFVNARENNVHPIGRARAIAHLRSYGQGKGGS